MTSSRTRNSILNFSITFIAGILLPLFGLIKYSLFIGLYGAEVNGIQITMESVIAVLNIFEICFSLAFRERLFKPLAEDDKNEVNRIYSSGLKIFRITGIIFLIVGLLVALAFPFFNESPFNVAETIIYFVILMLPYGISYFLMGPNLVLIADQKEYRINIWIQSIAILRMILMIVVIKLKLPVIWIFLIESIQILAANIISRNISKKLYPWLKEIKNVKDDGSLKKNIRYTLVQRLETIATSNIDVFVISVFINYTSASIYGAYNYIVDNINKIVNKALETVLNSFGHLFSTSEESYDVFLEFFEFVSFVASLIGICVCLFFNDFVGIWLKDSKDIFEAELPIVIILSFNIFYMILRESYIIGRDAKGLFRYAEKNAIIFTIVKLIGTLILVKVFGISGAIISTTIANLLVDLTFNPKLLCDKAFSGKTKEFYSKLITRTLIFVGIELVLLKIKDVTFGTTYGFMNFFISAAVMGVTCLILLLVIYYFMFPSFKKLTKRVKKLMIGK